MFFTNGAQYCYSLVYSVARAHFEKAPEDFELADYQRAYRRWANARQPKIPSHDESGPHFVTDRELEQKLLAPLAEPSLLDDLPQYADPTKFKRVGLDRQKTIADAAHASRALSSMRAKAPSFADVFDMFTIHLANVDGEKTWGGTNSRALGVIYLVDPQKRTNEDLHEVFVHEMTHLSLFVDETRRRHYLDYSTLHLPENFARSAVYELQRPLDKVLHSLVVATEVLLYRERVSGHQQTTSVHPPSEKLIESSLASAQSVIDLQTRTPVLAPRGMDLVYRCRDHLRGLVTTRASAA